MSLKGMFLKPLELIAGTEYPDIDKVQRDATADGASGSGVVESVTFARDQFREDLMHIEGLRKLLRNE